MTQSQAVAKCRETQNFDIGAHFREVSHQRVIELIGELKKVRKMNQSIRL